MTYDLLEGLRVLELGQFISAPYCGKLLADMGAQVIKIEPPGTGDWARQYGPFLHDDPHLERSGAFLYLNANKQSVTLNLKTPTGQGILAELVSRADVLVHNLHPLEMDALGVNYGSISQHNPNIVMASITPFGLTGPNRNYRAYDINLAAAGGICQGLGSAGREPLTFGTPQVGYFAGTAAASSIMMALLTLGPSQAFAASEQPSGQSSHFDEPTFEVPPFGKGGSGGISTGQGDGIPNEPAGQHIDIAEVETMAGVYNGPEALMAVYEWRATSITTTVNLTG